MSEGTWSTIISEGSSGIGDIIGDLLLTPGGFVSDLTKARQIQEEKKRYEKMRKFEREKFDFAKMLAMQDYSEKERKRKWKADLAHYLSFGSTGGLNATV